MPLARVVLGVVGAPQGIKGEVRVKCFLADPAMLGAYGPLATADGRTLTVAGLRPLRGDLVVARFAEIGDRNAAESLVRQEVSVPRAALPPTEDADTFYHVDLIGLAAETPDGRRLGRVTALRNHGAGDVIEIEGADGALLFPFTKAVTPVIDLAGGRIVVAPPAEIEGEPP
jgi:16S rRNA processing protein RimM